jgi:O-methyltransferase
MGDWGVMIALGPGMAAEVALLRWRGNDVWGGRCSCVAGDFFESVPKGADSYLLCGLVHDWNDDRAPQSWEIAVER